MTKLILNTEEFLESQGVEIEDYNYKHQIKLLRNVIFSRKIDLDVLDMRMSNHKSGLLVDDYINQRNIIDLQIYNARVCLSKVKLERRKSRLNAIKSTVKKLIKK